MSGHQLIVYDLSFFERLETKRPTALCGFVLAEHLGVKPNQPKRLYRLAGGCIIVLPVLRKTWCPRLDSNEH